MSAARETGLIARREILRNLRSTKGIAMFALFFLGGAIPSVLQVLALRFADRANMQAPPKEVQRQIFEQILRGEYDPETAQNLSACPPVLFGLFRGTLVFLPIFILLVGFDQIAGEIQHRSIRYLAGRAGRASIVAGKALGVWAVAAVMLLVLHATVWSIVLAQGRDEPSLILAWGLRLWLFSVAAAAASVGLTTLVSSLFRAPTVALFVGIAALFLLWLANKLLGLSPSTQALTWGFPATYEMLLVSAAPLRALGGVAALCAWGGALVAAAVLRIKKGDI
jgi:ABC-type transport system involved in multi-copper enzyme maturation permease subunit